MKLTRPSISKFILKDELLDLVVKISAAECYIHHGSEADRLTAASQLQALGRARALLRDAGADPSLLPAEGHSEETALRRAAIIDEVAQLLELFNLQSLQCSPLNIEDDLFLEYLVNCIRNEVICYQQFVSKTFKSTKSRLVERLSKLKKSPPLDMSLLSDLESQLNELCDREMRNEFEKFRHLGKNYTLFCKTSQNF